MGTAAGGAGGAGVVVERLCFRYPAREAASAPALSDVDFQLPPGAFAAIVGGNGSGKSTLLRLIGGLLPPTSGRIRIGGGAGRVAMVFQNPDNQLVASVVEDDVAFGPENLGVPSAEIGERVRASLAAVGMAERARSGTHQLSGGQKQRVAIAGALALQPDCLCLDEPTSLIDPAGRREVLAVPRAPPDAGRTVILVTHHMEEALAAERVLVLAGGRLVADGPPGAILADPARLRAWDLEVPPAVSVWESLLREDLAAGSAPVTLAELARRVAAASPGALRLPPAPAPAMGPAGGAGGVHLQGVRYTYPDPSVPKAARRPALGGVDLHLRPGGCVGLLGATGSGKTTLGLLCPALLAPDTGEVEIDGLRPWRERRRRQALQAARRRVGLVFQHPEDQFFEERVLDEVAFAPRNHGLPPAEAAQAARSALRWVGLDEEVAGRSPFALSGGQMRRVAIASILAAGPRYLVLDEPTAGLDAPGRLAVAALVRRFQAEGGGVLLVTHQMEEAAGLAEQVLALSGGRAALAGPVREVFAQADELAAAGLELPAAARLFSALRACGTAAAGTPLSLAEAVAALVAGLRAGGRRCSAT